ncbi:MAG: ABC transporter substrate-binding protein [Clostridiales bacterium]|nr:ABC transporter substrate-binding protein [Clostridiales bacterium]
MKKILALLLALSLTAALCAGCGSTQEETQTTDTTNTTTQEEDVTIRLGGLKGPTSMGMVKLLADNDAGTTTNHYEFTMAGSADELTPKMLQGELDILAVPVNLGSVLYNNSDGAVQLLAVNTLGVIYLVEKGGQTVTDWASLKGQTIYATGKGSTPEYALNYLLEENGLDPATDVTIEWKSEPTEIVAQMAAQDHVIALLPQPFVTVAQSKFEDLAISMDLTEEWDKLDNGSQLITAGLVVRTEFAKEHPQAVADFLEEYNASTAYVNENVAEAAQLVEQYDIVEAAVAEKAIPYCNIVCITGQEMMTSVQGYFQVLFDQNPQSVGGTLPGDDFYYLGQ